MPTKSNVATIFLEQNIAMNLVLRNRIRDPVLFYPPDPGYGMLLSRIPDPTYFCIKAINKFC
jgi:hypothetical protein